MADKKLVDKVEIYMDGKAEFRWRAMSNNGRIIADSGEGYVERREVVSVASELFPGIHQVVIPPEGKND